MKIFIPQGNENTTLLVQALTANNMARIEQGLLVESDKLEVIALLRTTGGVDVGTELTPVVEKPRCSICKRGYAKKDGLCTQCRQNKRKSENEAAQKHRIDSVVAKARVGEAIGATRLG